MLWPNGIDYKLAIDSFPDISILDSTLKSGNLQRGANNDLIFYVGEFAIVFPIETVSNTFALRCWIKDTGDAETRYREISDYLGQWGLPYFVDFAYVSEGILVNANKYPVTRMEWAEGEKLCDFIEQNLHNTECLKTAAAEFQKMVETLHAHRISHGHLQDGNILLKRNGTNVEIKLIDYDSLFVPALRGQPDNIVGLPEYQHPQRIVGDGGASEKVDYFSELVIYLSLLSLVEKPNLWSQFGDRTKRSLLFTAEDFKNPDQSDVFQALENLSPAVKQLAYELKGFCAELSINEFEPLEAILPKISPAQVAYDQGIAHLHNNRYNEAIVELGKTISLDPNYKEAYHGLGLSHFQMGNVGEAKRMVEAALRIDSHYQSALQLLDTIQQAKPQSTSLNRWWYITGALAFVLVIWIVVFAIQINKKDDVLHENQELQSQMTERKTQIISLRKENQELQDQLANKKTELNSQRDAKNTKNQIPIEQPSEGLPEFFDYKDPPIAYINTLPEFRIALLAQKEAKLEGERLAIGLISTSTMVQASWDYIDSITGILITLSDYYSTRHFSNQSPEEYFSEIISSRAGWHRTVAEPGGPGTGGTMISIIVAGGVMADVEEMVEDMVSFLTWGETFDRDSWLKRWRSDSHSDVESVPSPSYDQLRAAPPKKISNNIRHQVTLDALAKNNQGYLAFNRSQYDKAIDLFQDAEGSSPKSAVVHYNLGCTYLATGEYTNSITSFDRAVARDAKFKEAHYNLALALLRWGKLQAAKNVAHKALNIDSNFRPAYQLLESIKLIEDKQLANE